MSDLGLMDQEPRGRRAERNSRRRRRKRRKRNGCACLVVSVVLVGAVGAGGWYGYRFYESRFGPAPDYPGPGGSAVAVEIPDGAGTARIGAILTRAGVLKSIGAFTDQAKKASEKAAAIQPGTYQLRRRMTGAGAFKVLTDPKNINALTIPEGTRASKVYRLIDTKLQAKPGTTARAARDTDLGLPSYAHGNPEGFLYPTRYSVGDSTKPADLLKKMVGRARDTYQRIGLEDAAKKLDKKPYDLIRIASLVEAEAQQQEDFGKVSRVVDNRLAKNMKLEFDSTINYALHRSTLTTTSQDQRTQSPYNTYQHTGLPPAPICNPGGHALDAALHPTPGPWVYFVTVKPGDTRFTDSYAEHLKNVRDFNTYQAQHGKGGQR